MEIDKSIMTKYPRIYYGDIFFSLLINKFDFSFYTLDYNIILAHQLDKR